MPGTYFVASCDVHFTLFIRCMGRRIESSGLKIPALLLLLLLLLLL